MQGKYTSPAKFYYVKFYRFLLRQVLSRIQGWDRLDNPLPGYTIAIASHWRFPVMLEATLLFLSRQDLTHMDHVICAIDSTQTPEWEAAEERMKQRFPELKLEFLYQNRIQAAVCQIVKWGWINAWLSFTNCIAAAKTQHVILNDNDALLLDENLVENRYQTIKERGDKFVGIRWYKINGIEESDRILYTVNMAFDAQFLRNNCHPIEAFNDVRILNGHTVDTDILHQCQLRTPHRSILPIDEEQWVHPGQVISQFSYLSKGKGFAPINSNMFFIPYFEYLGGNPSILAEQTRVFEQAHSTEVTYLGYPMTLANIPETHLAKTRKRIERVEQYACGYLRPEVDRYLKSIESCISAQSGQKEPMEVA